MYHNSFIYLLVGRCLGCFQFLSVINKGGANIHVKVFVWPYVFITLGYKPGSDIAGSESVYVFNGPQTFASRSYQKK